jgi:hypothetical protein
MMESQVLYGIGMFQFDGQFFKRLLLQDRLKIRGDSELTQRFLDPDFPYYRCAEKNHILPAGDMPFHCRGQFRVIIQPPQQDVGIQQ